MESKYAEIYYRGSGFVELSAGVNKIIIIQRCRCQGWEGEEVTDSETIKEDRMSHVSVAYLAINFVPHIITLNYTIITQLITQYT